MNEGLGYAPSKSAFTAAGVLRLCNRSTTVTKILLEKKIILHQSFRFENLVFTSWRTASIRTIIMMEEKHTSIWVLSWHVHSTLVSRFDFIEVLFTLQKVTIYSRTIGRLQILEIQP